MYVPFSPVSNFKSICCLSAVKSWISCLWNIQVVFFVIAKTTVLQKCVGNYKWWKNTLKIEDLKHTNLITKEEERCLREGHKSFRVIKSRARQNFASSLQRCNSPLDWARELSKPSSDSTSLLLEIEKKTIFVFGLGFAGETAASGGIFAFFGHLYLALDHNPLRHYFVSIFVWKLGHNPRL